MNKIVIKIMAVALVAGGFSVLAPASAEAGWCAKKARHYYQPYYHRPHPVARYHARQRIHCERTRQARIRHQQRIAYEHYLRSLHRRPVHQARRCW